MANANSVSSPLAVPSDTMAGAATPTTLARPADPDALAIGLKNGDWATALPGLAAVGILLLLVFLRRRGVLVEHLTRRSGIDALSDIVEPVPAPGTALTPLTATTLEELTDICQRVVALWGKPACRAYLEELLQQGRLDPQKCLSLPVVQEVLFLIDLMAARDAG